MEKDKKIIVVLLLTVIAVAGFFRFWQLETIPPGLWPDEAINANTAVDILKKGDSRVFYPENHGREGLYFHIVALSFALFGISITSFKLAGAFIGVLTILGQYLFTKEVFIFAGYGKKYKEQHIRYIALLSSYFVAVSFWHINFSRIGFRAILMPLILVFSFYFLLRGWRTKRLYDFIAAGAIFGIGFHTYISFRLMVAVLGLMLVLLLFAAIKERTGKQFVALCTAFGIAMLLTALPIAIYFFQNPEDFFFRASGISIFGQEDVGPFTALAESGIKHLGIFNISGDQNWRHNIGGAPMLQPIVGLLFLFGLAILTKELAVALLKAVRQKFQAPLTPYYKFVAGTLLFSWFAVMLAPGVLTYEGIPHALRIIGIIPIIYLFAAFGAYLALSVLYKRSLTHAKLKRAYAVLLPALFVFLAINTFNSYFIYWSNHPQLEQSFTVRFMDVGRVLNELPEKTPKYVIKTEGDLPIEVPIFLQHTADRNDAVYIELADAGIIEFEPENIVLTMHKDASFFAPIIERYPESELEEFQRFYLLRIK